MVIWRAITTLLLNKHGKKDQTHYLATALKARQLVDNLLLNRGISTLYCNLILLFLGLLLMHLMVVDLHEAECFSSREIGQALQLAFQEKYVHKLFSFDCGWISLLGGGHSGQNDPFLTVQW